MYVHISKYIHGPGGRSTRVQRRLSWRTRESETLLETVSFLAWLGNGLGSSQNLPWSAQSLENDAPKRPQGHSNGRGCTLRNIWYLWGGSHFEPLGETSETDFFSVRCSRSIFLGYLMSFIDFGVKMVLQMDHFFPFDCFSMWSRRPQVAPEESRRRLGAKIAPK